MHIFATLARNPELFRRWIGFGGALLYGQLPRRLCELVILRTAYRFDGRYEWAQHVEMGAAVGVTHDEMAALGGDVDSLPWDALERAVIRAVDDTKDHGVVSDTTWATLSGSMSDSELIELMMLIGHYLMLTFVLRSIGTEVEPRAAKLAAEVQGGPAA